MRTCLLRLCLAAGTCLPSSRWPARAAFGQGNETDLSGVVTRPGRRGPGADVVAKNEPRRATIQGVTDGTGRFVLRRRAGHLHRHGLADGVQDRRAARRHADDRHAGVGQGDAGGRRAAGDGRRHRRGRSRADAERRSARRRVDQADSAACRSSRAPRSTTSSACRASRPRAATRAARRSTACRRRDEHHAGRRERAGQARAR